MRNLPITYNLIAISLASFLFVIAGLASVLYVLFQDHRGAFTTDAVLVISMRAAELYQRSPAPTPAEFDGSIRELIQASVIHGGVDAQGRPVDAYGTPFRLRHTVDGALHRAIATSAGRDRKFDTPDDISREATWETLASPAKQ